MAQDTYKSVALHALATGGTAAKAALDAEKAALDASRAEQVKTAMLSAAKMGADNQGVNTALDEIISAPALSMGQNFAAKAPYAGAKAAHGPQFGLLMDAEAAAGKAAAAGRGGRGGRGGGQRGRGGGGGSGGSGGHDEYWWNWYYDNELNKTFGGAGSGGLGRFNRYVESSSPLRGGQFGQAKQMGAPREYRVAQFGEAPTFDQLVREGAAQVASGERSRADFLAGLKWFASQGQGHGNAAKRGKKAINKAKKKK